MASIRTIKIGKAELKWNTGMIRSLYFDHPRIVGVYKNCRCLQECSQTQIARQDQKA